MFAAKSLTIGPGGAKPTQRATALGLVATGQGEHKIWRLAALVATALLNRCLTLFQMFRR